jgi:hypothetical protein
MKNCFIFLFLSFLFSSISFADSTMTCIRFPGLNDAMLDRPLLANQIGTAHFIIHWESPTTQAYAQNAADHAEYDAYQKECTEMNW